jgi:hypothetical protein
MLSTGSNININKKELLLVRFEGVRRTWRPLRCRLDPAAEVSFKAWTVNGRNKLVTKQMLLHQLTVCIEFGLVSGE